MTLKLVIKISDHTKNWRILGYVNVLQFFLIYFDIVLLVYAILYWLNFLDGLISFKLIWAIKIRCPHQLDVFF